MNSTYDFHYKTIRILQFSDLMMFFRDMLDY